MIPGGKLVPWRPIAGNKAQHNAKCCRCVDNGFAREISDLIFPAGWVILINSRKLKQLAVGGTALAMLIVTGCDREPAAPAAAAAPAPAAVAAAPAVPTFSPSWDVRDPQATSVSGDAAVGYAVKVSDKAALSALFRDLSVLSGDTVKLSMNLAGDEGKLLRVVLIRHCDAQNGEDFESATVKLTAAPKPVELNHTFAHDYRCVRLSLQSATGEPVAAQISNLVVTRSRP